MIIIKLGGSIITYKKKALTPNISNINKIIKRLKMIDEPYVVIHGGGSFGHYWSVKYDMHTEPKEYNAKGIVTVKNSMIELNKIVLDLFLKNNINPYPFPASNFIYKDKPIIKKIKEIEDISRSMLVPISYGDIVWYERKKSYILSGDRIMTILARILRPKLTIFILDVDGLYSNFKEKKIISVINGNRPDIKIGGDSTGGMKRKFKEAKNISKMGLKVFFVNGNRPERIIDAMKGRGFEGTLFK